MIRIECAKGNWLITYSPDPETDYWIREQNFNGVAGEISTISGFALIEKIEILKRKNYRIEIFDDN